LNIPDYSPYYPNWVVSGTVRDSRTCYFSDANGRWDCDWPSNPSYTLLEGDDIPGNDFVISRPDCRNVKFEFVGKSTSIKLYQPQCSCYADETNVIMVDFKKIEEVTPSGDIVNKIPTITNYHPVLSEQQNTTKFGLDATYVSVVGPVSTNGKDRFEMQLDIELYFFHLPPVALGSGTGSVDNGHIVIYDNSLKFDMKMSGWQFKSSDNNLRFTIRIHSSSGAVGANTYEVDGGYVSNIPTTGNQFATIQVPNDVVVDGSSQQFTVNYELHGTNTDLEFYFPSFSNNLEYDPFVYLPLRTCGNNQLDEGEECDYGGDGCDNQCKCVAPNYVSVGQYDCQRVTNNLNTGLSSNAGSIVAVVVVVLVTVAVA
jgi:hypothetical protein